MIKINISYNSSPFYYNILQDNNTAQPDGALDLPKEGTEPGQDEGNHNQYTQPHH